MPPTSPVLESTDRLTINKALEYTPAGKLAKRAGIGMTTLTRYRKGGVLSPTTIGMLVRAAREVLTEVGHAPEPVLEEEQAEREAKIVLLPPDGQIPPRDKSEEDSVTDAATGTPVAVAPAPSRIPAPGSRRVDTQVVMKGEAGDVQAAAAQLGSGGAGQAPQIPGGPSPMSQVEKLLSDPSTRVRVDRVRPSEQARIWEPNAPIALGEIQRRTEDDFGGGTYRVRILPGDGRPGLEYNFTLPGKAVILENHEGAAKREEAPEKDKLAASTMAEAERMRAQREKILAEIELEEAKKRLEAVQAGKPKPDAAAPASVMTPESITAMVQQTVTAALAPIMATQREKSMEDRFAQMLKEVQESNRRQIEALVPKQKSPELAALEDQLEEMSTHLENLRFREDEGGRREKPPDILDMIEKVSKLIRPPAERQKSSTLEELAVQRLLDEIDDLKNRGDIGEKPEENVLKMALKELIPALKDVIKESRAKSGAQGMSKEEAEKAISAQAALAAQNVIAQIRAQQMALPQPAPVPQPGPARATPQTTPLPPSASRPAPAPAPAEPPQEEPIVDPPVRSPAAVNTTLQILIDEIKVKNMPRDSEWLAEALDCLPEPILDSILEVQDGDELRDLLAANGADPGLLSEVTELGKDRRVKIYIERGIISIQDEWIREKQGDFDVEPPAV